MKIYHFSSIETPRLLIRPVQLGDEIPLNKAIHRSLSLLQRWEPWAKNPSLEETQKFVERAVAMWVSEHPNDFPMTVIYKENEEIIAASGFNDRSNPEKFSYEVGYWLDVNYQGQGLATEILNALTRYALFELDATRVQICTHAKNVKSAAVAKRCGYTLEATFKDHRIDCESGLLANSVLYSCQDINVLPGLEITCKHKISK
jgi:RimJ/RimL family protein N-acetyltransferase